MIYGERIETVMKEIYEELEMEVIVFDAEDITVTSENEGPLNPLNTPDSLDF